MGNSPQGLGPRTSKTNPSLSAPSMRKVSAPESTVVQGKSHRETQAPVTVSEIPVQGDGPRAAAESARPLAGVVLRLRKYGLSANNWSRVLPRWPNSSHHWPQMGMALVGAAWSD